jgi:DNA-binding SARP family transcriptional activator
MLQRIGDRAGALHLYEDCARRMRSELDTAPSAETEALVAELRKG